MDTMTNKQYEDYDYTCRYTPFAFYYDKLADRYVYGVGANMSKNLSWVAHKVKSTDTLEKLALNYYNNPTYWWVIAYFNDIQDAFIKLNSKFEIIKIPNIASISFSTQR